VPRFTFSVRSCELPTRSRRGRAVAQAWEAEALGLARLTALLEVLAEARIALTRYLTDPAISIWIRIGASHDAHRIESDTDTLLEYSAMAFSLPARERDDATFMYELQTDVIENYRWVTSAFASLRDIDGALMVYLEVYGKQIGETEEGKALLAARENYVKLIADNPVATSAQLAVIRKQADEFYADWFGRAADERYTQLDRLLSQLLEPMRDLDKVKQWDDDKYSDRYRRILSELSTMEADLRDAKARPRGPEYLAAVVAITQQTPVLAIRVYILQLWAAAHRLLVVITDKNIGSVVEQREWYSILYREKLWLSEQYDKPDFQNDLAGKLALEQRAFEAIQQRIGEAAKWEAITKIYVTIVAIYVTGGLAAPEAGFVSVALGGAAIMTGATVLGDLAMHKSISLGDVTIDFAKNVALFGFMHILNLKLFAIALNAPGQDDHAPDRRLRRCSDSQRATTIDHRATPEWRVARAHDAVFRSQPGLERHCGGGHWPEDDRRIE
jgi:hypothetical protein